MVPTFAHPLGILISQRLRGYMVDPSPSREFVLDQDSHFVGDFVPGLWRESDAVAQAVPVHLLHSSMQLPYPLFLPWQVPALLILEEAIQREVASAEKVRLAVEA